MSCKASYTAFAVGYCASVDSAVMLVVRFVVHSVVYDAVSSATGDNVIVPSELNLAFIYFVEDELGVDKTISPFVVTANPFFPPIPTIN